MCDSDTVKFYIATRYSNEKYRQLALQLKAELESHGHQMTFDWMNGENVKPYNDNPEKTTVVAKKALDGAKNADFFILIPEENGTGMYVEFGAAIAEFERTGAPKMFVMGEDKFSVLFNFHPACTFVDSLDEVLELLEG